MDHTAQGLFFINNPIFVKYKKRFVWKSFRPEAYLKSVFVNERIVEVPFVFQSLQGVPAVKKVLDLGCTESPLPLQLASLGFQVTGFDFREYPYKHPNLNFVQGNMLNLPFEDESYDVVCCISTIEHIGIGSYDDPLTTADGDFKAMAEVRRVLKKDGKLILSVPYGVYEENTHQRVYDEGRLSELLKDFRVENKRYFINQTKTAWPNNHWLESSRAEAAAMTSSKTTNGVCCLTAKF